jgi:sorbitol-specific phosphotransferase system component IIC
VGHYLAFDLFTGAWEARDAVRLGISRWAVLPCLVLTFLFGPMGLALYLLVKLAMRKSVGAEVVA